MTGYVSCKVLGAVGAINSLKYNFLTNIQVMLYNSISLHFDCCLLIWGSNIQNTFLLKNKLYVFYDTVNF